MTFLEKLILGLVGAELLEDAERFHGQHLQMREQQRRDSLFWQDAARRDSNAYEDDDDDWF